LSSAVELKMNCESQTRTRLTSVGESYI